MKVILVPSTSDPVGVATSVYNLALLFDTYGYLSDVVCPGRGWLTEQLDRDDIPNTVLPLSFSLKRFLRSSVLLLHYLRESPPSIVHLNGRFPLFVALLSILLLRKHRYVVTIRQFSVTGSHGAFRWKEHLETVILQTFVFKIICVSLSLKSDIVKRIGSRFKTKILHIHNIIQPLHSERPLDLVTYNTSSVRIVAAGRLSSEKGFDVLIKAIAILSLDGLKVKCDIYGSGPESDHLNKLISDLALNGTVSLRGANLRLRSILPRYNLAVVPSREESFGLVVLECYDAGLPVVASNIPGLSEIIISGKTGLLFNVGDPNDLSAKIRGVIADSRFTQSIRLGGRALLQSYIPNRDLLELYLSAFGLNDSN